MKVTVLGCGGSAGVPFADGTPGGNWGLCDPANPKNRRSRVSVLVEEGPASILIDASPDLRQQIIDNGIDRLDAVLFTHAHADHCHGLDELRSLVRNRRRALPAWMDSRTHEALTARFAYAFASSRAEDNLYPALMDDRLIEGPFKVEGVEILPFEQNHGPETTLGFRIGRFAYSTDAKKLDEAAFAALEGIELWVVDCLREAPHPTHSHLEQTLEWIARVKPRHAILTHLNHQADYEALRRLCPPGVEPGYDGLSVTL